MIKFFRRIRKRLLSDNRFTKYLIYALGEIVLVVIGILIALQINSNYQKKQTRLYELKMLNEIRQELMQDTAYFYMIRKRAQSLQNAGIGFAQYYDVKNPPLDSLSKYRTMLKGFYFTYRKGAYEALKTTGLDKVSNDSLRKSITSLYDFVLPRIALLINRRQTEELGVWNNHVLEVSALQLVKDSMGVKSFQSVPRTDLYKNPRAASVIDRYEYIGSEGVSRINTAIIQSNWVLEILNKELEKHD